MTGSGRNAALLLALTLAAQPVAGRSESSLATWRISETPLGMFADGRSDTGKESAFTWVQGGSSLGLRYLQYRYPARQAGTLVSCRRPLLTQCDPQHRELGLLAGRERQHGPHRLHYALGVAALSRQDAGGATHRGWGMALQSGYYRTLGDYFALGASVAADINRANSFAGVLFSLHYGKLR